MERVKEKVREKDGVTSRGSAEEHGVNNARRTEVGATSGSAKRKAAEREDYSNGGAKERAADSESYSRGGANKSPHGGTKGDSQSSEGGGASGGERAREGGSRGKNDWLKRRLSELRLGEKNALLYKVAVLILGVIFARCHTVFGARPLGIMLAALLPENVWVAATGAALGSLTMGGEGIIFAIAVAITVFLRVIISGGFGDGHRLFCESLGARMCESVVGGFVVGAYELLLRGFGLSSVLFSAAMVLLPPLFLFLLSGLYNTGISLTSLFSGSGGALTLSGKDDTEKLNAVFFGLSALTLTFLISLSLADFTLLGISLSYIFTGFVTLLVAKRMGPLRALAVGFVAPLGLSGVYSVAFALAGLGAGLLFSFGTVYALILGGVLLSAWSGYAAGLEGLLTTLPEYLIAATLYAPIAKSVEQERTPERAEVITESARDMVGTVALKYQGSRSSSLDSLELSLSSLAELIRGYTEEHKPLTEEEYEGLVLRVAERVCSGCDGRGLCASQDISPCTKNAGKIAKKLALGEKITADDVNTDTEFCTLAGRLAEEISRAVARAAFESKSCTMAEASADEYELISRMISEVRYSDMAERVAAEELTEPLSEVMRSFGFEDGVARAFGKRRRHFILAVQDEGGGRISSEGLRLGIEAAAGVRLGSPEYYRNGKMALMECEAVRAYRVECASGMISGSDGEVSGDSVLMFESSDERFFAAISDGMGKGTLARDTSSFVVRFLERALDFGASRETVLHLLNNSLIRRREECSATVDLFELDLILGEATFIKSGAAPSFIKRDSSIFRIKSSTAPIGLMKSIDSEKIRVEVREGDIVIMLSDGILQSGEESTWLLELLSRKPKQNLKEYAEYILAEAKKNSRSGDDMTVVVARISGM